MSTAKDGDLSSFSMTDLFRMEVETHATVLTNALLSIERNPADQARLHELMRAAHSIKGAARMIGQNEVVRVAHTMEDLFVAAREGKYVVSAQHVDILLRGIDLITCFANTASEDGTPSASAPCGDVQSFLDELAVALDATVATTVATRESPSEQRHEPLPPPLPPPLPAPLPAPVPEPIPEPLPAAPKIEEETPQATQSSPSPVSSATNAPATDAMQAAVRVSADQLNRLLGLAGESLVISRWVPMFARELTRLKQLQDSLAQSVRAAREQAVSDAGERTRAALERANAQAIQCNTVFQSCLEQFDNFDRRSIGVSHRLYQEVLAARMRPFKDGTQGLPRMVRDVARSLGKEVRFDIDGENTPVDRDILQRLEAPLVHILRNVVDHGIESPEERRQAGKPVEGRVVLAARHNAGMLIVSVTDDGRGVDAERIRQLVVERNLTTLDVASKLSSAELLELLFLPGFSTKDGVSEISGRGVGLDAVKMMTREVGGTAEITSQPGRGMRVQLQLPLTLSVVRTLIVDVDDESYAIPLARVVRVVKISRQDVQSVEGHEHVIIDGRTIGLVSARHVLGASAAIQSTADLPVVILGNATAQYGFVVDALRGERELVVRPLDPRLGKVPDVSAAALLPDGTPTLIVDVDDLVRSIEVAVSGGRLTSLRGSETTTVTAQRRRILVVDDSITVRETERKLLENAGYAVDVAVDGMDGWNAIRTGHYDLLVTDVDMPRLTGIELTTLVRKDERLRSLPIMIVSYKDREEDRLHGLDAGADYYLTKASFHDDTLLRAVADLIGAGDGTT